MKVLAIMSGSSLDGTDIGIIEINEILGKIEWKIERACTVNLTNTWASDLRNAVYLSSYELLKLNAEYARYMASLVHSFDGEYDIISFHGHTLFHYPEEGFSFQLGNGASLATLTRSTVVCDFRNQDIALGGQGAPLMSLVDDLLFSQYSISINLGGICNMTARTIDFDVSMDIAPCNQLLNHLAKEIGLDYDANGDQAKKGMFVEEYFNFLGSDPYYKKQAPKSLDNQYIYRNVLELEKKFDFKINDKLYTAVDFISSKITEEILRFDEKLLNRKAIVSGGGALNTYLLDRLSASLKKSNISLDVPNAQLINYKELLLMGLLAFLRVDNRYNVLSKLTGSLRDSISGAIYEGKN